MIFFNFTSTAILSTEKIHHGDFQFFQRAAQVPLMQKPSSAGGHEEVDEPERKVDLPRDHLFYVALEVEGKAADHHAAALRVPYRVGAAEVHARIPHAADVDTTRLRSVSHIA